MRQQENDRMGEAGSGTTAQVDIGPESTYVVQRKLSHETMDDSGQQRVAGAAWEDVATVTVPARSKRRAVVAKAIEQAGLTVGEDGVTVRVLDRSSAEEIPVRPVPQPSKLEIG